MPRLALITTLWVVLCLQAVQAQTVIRVSPTGGTAGGTAGSLSLPDALTKLKDPSLRNAMGEPLAAITLQLEPGMYRISQTLMLDAASSGSAAHPVTIQGPKDGSAIITGGQAVNSFTPVTDPSTLARLPEAARAHVLQTSLPQQGLTNYGTQARHGWGAHNVPTALTLAYRNTPLTLARWPNDGFAQIATTPDGEKGSTFTLPHPNLQAWQAEPHLLATGYWFHNWADATIPVQAINPATQLVALAGTTPPYGIKAGNRVFIQNALAELDQSGEWYLDTATGTLYVWPPAPPQPRPTNTRPAPLVLMRSTDSASSSGVMGRNGGASNPTTFKLGNATTMRWASRPNVSRELPKKYTGNFSASHRANNAQVRSGPLTRPCSWCPSLRSIHATGAPSGVAKSAAATTLPKSGSWVAVTTTCTLASTT